MQTIGTKIVNDVIYPESAFPEPAIKIVFNGTEYIVYEEGDELPEPVSE